MHSFYNKNRCMGRLESLLSNYDVFKLNMGRREVFH